MSRPIPKPGEEYQHFKGKKYEIITIARHTEDDEDLVVYKALYEPYTVYARPLTMFMEKVDRAKYPDVRQFYRFERCDQYDFETHTIAIDPSLLKFLDADTYEDKFELLKELNGKLTPEILTPMELSLGIEPSDKSVEERYQDLKGQLMTKMRFEKPRF